MACVAHWIVTLKKGSISWIVAQIKESSFRIRRGSIDRWSDVSGRIWRARSLWSIMLMPGFVMKIVLVRSFDITLIHECSTDASEAEDDHLAIKALLKPRISRAVCPTKLLTVTFVSRRLINVRANRCTDSTHDPSLVYRIREDNFDDVRHKFRRRRIQNFERWNRCCNVVKPSDVTECRWIEQRHGAFHVTVSLSNSAADARCRTGVRGDRLGRSGLA